MKNFLLLLFILLSFSIAHSKEIFYQLSQTEVDEANKIYNACGGEDWNLNLGWPLTTDKFDGNDPVFGIYYNSSNTDIISEDDNIIIYEIFISQIKLPKNNLVGKMPTLNLSRLEFLDLSENQISGEIQNFNYKYFLYIDLSNNQFSGEIPAFILPSLQYLNLSNNSLSGEIPDFKMRYLIRLYLHENNLNGTIPNFDLERLEQLYLHENNLSGNIPDFNLPNLVLLIMDNNNLSGNIPDFDLSNLTHLQVSGNKFTFEDLEINTGKYQNYIYSPQNINLPITNSGEMLEVITPGSANTYQWYRNENALQNGKSAILNITKNGKYKCEVRNTLLPDLTLESEEITVTNLGISQSQSDNKIKIIQRGDQLIIKYLGNDLANQIKIFNTNGKIIYSSINLVKPINTGNFKSGVYFISLEIGEEIINEKFIFSK
jgi:Leucine Rich Repeat